MGFLSGPRNRAADLLLGASPNQTSDDAELLQRQLSPGETQTALLCSRKHVPILSGVVLPLQDHAARGSVNGRSRHVTQEPELRRGRHFQPRSSQLQAVPPDRAAPGAKDPPEAAG